MADPAEQHWRDVARDARRQAHANAQHCDDLLDGVLKGCDAILLATEVIPSHGARLAFIEDMYTTLRRAVNQKDKPAEVEGPVRAIWERWRGN
jgi:hypothetical protein